MEHTQEGIAPRQVRDLKGQLVIVLSQWTEPQWLITPILHTDVQRTPNEFQTAHINGYIVSGQMSATTSEEWLLKNSKVVDEISERDRQIICWQFFSNMPVDHTLPEGVTQQEIDSRCGEKWPESFEEQEPLWRAVEADVRSDAAIFNAVLEPWDPDDGEALDTSNEALQKEKEMILERVHNCIDGADYVGEEDLRDRLRQCVNLVMWSLSLYDKAVCNSKEE